MRILVDLTHTSHSRARTGIQRVARALFEMEGSEPICHDRYANSWRPLRPAEEALLDNEHAQPGSRRSHWPISSRIAGVLSRKGKKTAIRLPAAAHDHGLVVPEIFSPEVARALPALFQSVSGPRAAVFHDAIALKLPEYAPAKTVARFPGYMRELLLFDGIAATSDDSRDALLDYWRWLRVQQHPPVQTIPLGVDQPPPSLRLASPPSPRGEDSRAVGLSGNLIAAPTSRPSDHPTIRPSVLCVGTIEGRKNHLALLEAAESLWKAGMKFELRLVGLPRPETASAALERIRVLRAAGRPLRCDGAVTDAALEAAYSECTFTVYPSLMEGFGLPVLESVARGKPCICSARGALGESARGGGCIALAAVDPGSLAEAIRSLLENPSGISELAMRARARKLREWRDYSDDVSQWLWTLRRPSR